MNFFFTFAKVMRKLFKHISCLLFLLSSLMMHGQGLPSLGTAQEIQRGSLPDGIQFYLVTNPDRKGYADFALVQRGRRNISNAQELLRELPHFGKRAPYQFLAENGIGYGPEGFISLPADAALFTFHDVPTHNESVADSTLLMLFDIAAAYRKPQAVVISGDIDAAKIRERMGLLSMMVPALDNNYPGSAYQWTPNDSLSLLVSQQAGREVAAINVIYRTQRLPKSFMNTPQPLVMRAYAEQLGRIAGRRMEQRFRAAGIPLAGFRYRYQDSAQGPEDERHTLTVYTAAPQLDSAVRCVASVLAGLDLDGASMEEFLEARDWQIAEARREGARKLRNDEYLERCVASYLYGAHLASGDMLSVFIGTHRLDDARERELFNGFARALLDPERNLTLRLDLPRTDVDRAALRKAFLDSWSATAGGVAAEPAVLPERPVSAKRVRLSGDAAEPLSGGRLWTFSNGMKVIYKKMNTPHEFHYCWMLRGGVAEVPDLRAGESAFVGDMLALSRVGGMSGAEFCERLDASGITLHAAASLSDLRIGGRAPSAEFSRVMQALLWLADKREVDAEAFAAYRREEALRLDREANSPRDVNDLMDGILRPDFFYPERKQMDCLSDDLPARAEQYFAQLFDKAGDGVLLLMGDLEEEALKKELTRTLGAFRTEKRFSVRPHVESRFATGTVSRTEEAAAGVAGGSEIGVNVVRSAALPYKLDSYLSFQVACMLVRQRLAGALAEQGAWAELTGRLELFPSERISIYVNCHPCPDRGLPAGVRAGGTGDLLDAVRSVTRRLDEIEVSEAEVRAARATLLKELELRYARPETLMEDVLLRYSEGKDLMTNYKGAVQRISAAGVKEILQILSGGGEVEYTII